MFVCVHLLIFLWYCVIGVVQLHVMSAQPMILKLTKQ